MRLVVDLNRLEGFDEWVEKARKGEQIGGSYIYRENIPEKVTAKNGKTVTRRYRYYYVADMLKDTADKILKNIGSFFFKGNPEEVKRIEKSYETENIQKDYGADKKTWYQHVMEYFSHRALWDKRFSDKTAAERWKKPVKTAVAEKVDVKGMETPAESAPEIKTSVEAKKPEKKWKANPSLMRKVWSLYTGKLAEKQEKQTETAAKVIEENKKKAESAKNDFQIEQILSDTAEKEPEKIKFTRENFNKLFKNGVDTPIEKVKVGEHQFEKLEEKGRTDLLASMYETLKNPSAIAQAENGAKLYIKSFIGKQRQKNIVSVVVDKGELHIAISTHEERLKQIEKKITGILYKKNSGYNGVETPYDGTVRNESVADKTYSVSIDNIPQSGGKVKDSFESLSRCKSLYNEAYRQAMQDLRDGKTLQIDDDTSLAIDDLAEDKQAAELSLRFYTTHFTDWNSLDTVNATLEMYAEEPDDRTDENVIRMAKEKAVQDSLKAYLGLNVNLPESEESEAEKHKNRSDAMLGNQNARKDFKDLSDIIKNKSSLNLKNDSIGEIKLTYAVNKSDLKHIIERRYAELKNKYHIENEDERRKLLTAFVYSLLQTVKHGSAEIQKDGRSYILRNSGISAIARQNSDGKIVVTGFVDNSNEKEGAETISAVNAEYGYAPEFLELYASVGAALSASNIPQNEKLSNNGAISAETGDNNSGGNANGENNTGAEPAGLSERAGDLRSGRGEEPGSQNAAGAAREDNGIEAVLGLDTSGNGLGNADSSINIGRGRITKGQAREIRRQCREILQKPDSAITADDKAVLAQYVGAGGTGEENSSNSGVLYEFYTPRNVISKVWQIVDKYNPDQGKTVIEPSSGIGRFAEGRKEKFTMFELEDESARIAHILHPDADVVQGAFQENFMKNKGGRFTKKFKPYDVAVGNPPYGAYTGKYKGLGEGKEYKRYETYFMSRTLDTLKDGGVIAMVVPSGFMDGKSTYGKDIEKIAEKGELLEAWRLPNGTFDSTDVGTDIVVFRKGKGGSAEQIKSYFEKNPDHIAGEISTRTNRFGKEESYVKPKDGQTFESAVDSIDVGAREIKEQADAISELIGAKETEAEKHQSRSEAMKGNQNARKPFSDMSAEEKAQKAQQIRNNVVASVKADSVFYNGDGRFAKAAKEWVKNNPQGNAHSVIGEIMITPNSADSDLRHGDKQDLYMKLQTLPAVKDILENGTYLGYERDFNGKNISNHYFAGKIKYGNDEKIVFCRVRETDGLKGRFYVHEVFTEDEVKKEALQVPEIDAGLPQLTGKPLYKYILQDVLDVNKNSRDVVYTTDTGNGWMPKEAPVASTILHSDKKSSAGRKLDISDKLKDTGRTGTARNGKNYKIWDTTDDFWSIYKQKKDALKENGYQLVKTRGSWKVYDYNADGGISTEKTDAEKKENRSRAMLGNKNAEGGHNVPVNPNAHKMSVEEFNKKYGKNFDPKDVPIWKATDRSGNIDITRLSNEEVDYVAKSDHYVKDGGMYVNVVNYASGNIREKLNALSSDDPQYEVKKALLENVCPKEKKIGEFTLSPITNWAREYKTMDGKSLIDGFFEWAYNGNGYYSAGDSPVAREEIPPDISFNDIKDFIDKVPYQMSRAESRDFDDKKQREKAKERRKQQRRETAIKLFNRYLQEGLALDEQKRLTEAWNLKANSFVNPDFTKIPVFVDGMSTHKGGNEFTLFDQQMKGISMLTNKGTGLLAYDVGVGKTACGVVATVNQIQTGRAKRPLICVPKAVYSNWIDNIHELFPDIKVNGLGNLSKSFWNSGMTIEPGSISVCTYEGLENISFNTQEETELREDLEFAEYTDNGEKQTARQKASAAEKVLEKIGSMQRTRDEGVQFSDLGFDHITVDEVHNFRNLFKMPRHIKKNKEDEDKVESNEFDGLGAGGEPSERAKKLFAITQLIQRHNDGRNTFLLSATPFQNSPTEIYSILSYMARDELKKRGFYSLEQFVSNFCKVQREYVVKANRVTEAPVVKGFENLKELQNLLISYMDKVDGEEAGVVRPYKRMHAPELELSEMQKDIMDNISNYIEEQEQKPKKERDDGYMFRAMNAMKNCALSPALVTDTEFNPYGGKKLDFVETSPKLKFVCDSIIAQYKKDSHNGQIMYMPLGVEQFPKVKDYLVKHGMPKDAIATISGGATTDKAMEARDSIFNDFNDVNGKCKVIIGSSTIKEGCNLQGNTTTIYCTQLDWNPTDVQQLWGRGWRQGNRQGIVHCVTPLMHDSLDPMIYQKHDEKSSRTNDIYSYKGDAMNSQDVNPEELKFSLIKDPEKRADLQVMEYSEKNKSDEKMYGQLIDVLHKQIDIAFESDKEIESRCNTVLPFRMNRTLEGLLEENKRNKAGLDSAKKAITVLTKKYKGKDEKWNEDYSKITEELNALDISNLYISTFRTQSFDETIGDLNASSRSLQANIDSNNSYIRMYNKTKTKLEKTREATKKYLESKGMKSKADCEQKIQDYVKLMDTAKENAAKAKDMRDEFYKKAVEDNARNEKNLLSVDELVKENVDSIMGDLHLMDDDFKAKIKTENDRRFGRVAKSLPLFFIMDGRLYINRSRIGM